MLTVRNVFTAFFEQKSRASTIQLTVALETTINVLGHVDLPSSIVANVSFQDENEGDAFDSKAGDNGTAKAIEAEVINGYAEQEATDDVGLPPTAKYSEIRIHLRLDFLR
ncbi:hypothetical protein MAM1_0699d11131 [Mucor ambiguus]|uniref:Uncharacterized protein n=1 Tax=Mucor ambiguus TaxID=91626 RepID=A0A0C9N672_9FUNG|nr:hypothetical protein MAM1_0699d11131 [Mucor ambiguus]